MKNLKNYVVIVMFALVSYVATAYSNEPIALVEGNAEAVLGADYRGRISIKIPNNVVEIGAHVFKDCKYLENVTIPEGVTKIGQNAFSNCVNLKSLEIPNSVNELGYGVFAGCEKLTTVVLPDGLTKLSGHIFTDCKSLKTVSIPSSVIDIEEYAFYRCHSLTDMRIPKNVVKVDVYVFKGCGNLTTVTFEDTNNWETARTAFIRNRLEDVYEEMEVSDPAKNAEMFKTLSRKETPYRLIKKER